MIRHIAAVTFTATATFLLGAAGCSSSSDDLGSAESAATPPNPSTQFALAETCSRLFKRHASLREVDLKEGVIRWGCGDVPGVTDPDLGQEYCEYQAVQNGKIVKKATDIATGPMACVFTSVFRDAGQAAALKPQMADPANLGVAVEADRVVQMVGGFNSRGAATQLLADCSRDPGVAEETKRLRTTAIFQAYALGGPNAARLQQIGTTTITDATWAEAQALGAKIVAQGEPGYESQQDIQACMQVRNAGVPWRNSDPMICSRTARSAQDCSCKFGAVPNALKGVPFTGWVDDHIPASCRLAKVDGADYPFIAICDVTEQEISDIPLNPLYARSLGNFCRDRFGVDLVMKLPLRDLQRPDTCAQSAGFCKEYMGVPEAEPTPTPAPTPEPTPTAPGRTTGAPPGPPPAAAGAQ